MTTAKLLLGAALIIASSMVSQSRAQVIGSSGLPSLPNSGLAPVTPSPPIYQGPGTYLNSGSQTFGSNGTTQIQSGNQALGSDGNVSRTYGNMTYGSDGTMIQRSGNTNFVTTPDGRTHTCQTIGSQTFCN